MNKNETTTLPKTMTVTRDGQTMTGVVTRISAEIALPTGKRVFKTLTAEDLCSTPDEAAEFEIAAPTWSINQKFNFLADLINMVVEKVTCSLVITGSGGLGKTSSVLRALSSSGLQEGSDYTVLKGYSTPKGLYEFLYRHNGELIVIDDCDSVFNTETGVNILKGALDSYETRTICWQSRETSSDDDSIPSRFEFTGRVIFISNRSQDDVPQPVRSRSMNIDLTMTITERLDRIQFLLPSLAERESLSIEQATEAYNIIVDNQKTIRDINIRTMVMALRVRKTAHVDSWRDLAVFQLTHN